MLTFLFEKIKTLIASNLKIIDKIYIYTLIIFTLIFAVPWIIFGATTKTYAELEQEQIDYFYQNQKYFHIPWTYANGVKYKINEYLYPDGSQSFRLEYLTLKSVLTATGSQEIYE